MRRARLLAFGVVFLALATLAVAWMIWARQGARLAIGRPSPEPRPAPADYVAPSPRPSPTPDILARLVQNPMSPRDYVALVSSLRPDGQAVPRVVRDAPLELRVGDRRAFWISDMDTSRTYLITATLQLLTEHLQMWVDERAQVDTSALERSARVFEERIYPTNRAMLGSEWRPGIDGDVRLVVLNAPFSGAAGYFASANEYSRLVNPYSNECEMFVMNPDVLTPGTPQYDSVLAHEFAHMIQWNVDSNEDAWVNEGAAELAEDLNGFGAPENWLRRFAHSPDTQLNHWVHQPGEMGAHYAASYLILRYFLDRFGREAVRELLQHPANGMAAFDAVLAARGTGLTFADLYADWLVANVLDDPDVGDGRYGYSAFDIKAQYRARLTQFPLTYSGQLNQFGADYIELSPAVTGTLRLTFEGTPQVKLVPNEPTSGRHQWWSNRGDVSHATLERAFDLTGVTSATLTFSLWYDIEEGWDYAYVRASTDGGQSWQLLRGTHMTDTNPAGNALGPGYTGKSGGQPDQATWVREVLDLGPYCGQRVLVRFDYVTDDAVNEVGLCLDDLELAAVGWADDAEAGEDGWRAQGFIRHDNILPQRYLVQLVEFAPAPVVRRLAVGEDGRGTWLVEGFGERLERAVLIISPVTTVTTERAEYALRVERAP